MREVVLHSVGERFLGCGEGASAAVEVRARVTSPTRFHAISTRSDRRVAPPEPLAAPRAPFPPGHSFSITRSACSPRSSRARPARTSAIRSYGQLLVLAWLRGFMSDAGMPPGWLKVLTDQQLRPALALIHEQPGRSWSLTDLARASAMSRSAFAQRFKDVAGTPPLAYLISWRMLQARRRLSQGRSPLGPLALELGYFSDSAFSAAFKRRSRSLSRQPSGTASRLTPADDPGRICRDNSATIGSMYRPQPKPMAGSTGQSATGHSRGDVIARSLRRAGVARARVSVVSRSALEASASGVEPRSTRTRLLVA